MARSVPRRPTQHVIVTMAPATTSSIQAQREGPQQQGLPIEYIRGCCTVLIRREVAAMALLLLPLPPPLLLLPLLLVVLPPLLLVLSLMKAMEVEVEVQQRLWEHQHFCCSLLSRISAVCSRRRGCCWRHCQPCNRYRSMVLSTQGLEQELEQGLEQGLVECLLSPHTFLGGTPHTSRRRLNSSTCKTDKPTVVPWIV